MAGLDPAIHVFAAVERKAWMPGSIPGMTEERASRAKRRPGVMGPGFRQDDGGLRGAIYSPGTMLGARMASRCSGRSRLAWARYSSATRRSRRLSSVATVAESNL